MTCKEAPCPGMSQNVHVAIDAIGIKNFGGASLLCDLIVHLPKVRPDWTWDLFVFARPDREFELPNVSCNVTVHECRNYAGPIPRLRWVYGGFAQTTSRVGADVALAFANLGIQADVPLVAYCHQPLAVLPLSGMRLSARDRLRLKVLGTVLRKTVRTSSAVIVQTDAMKEGIIRMGAPDKRIHVIPIGWHRRCDHFPLRPELLQVLRSAEHSAVIYVAQPALHKNHVTLLRAWQSVADQHCSAKLYLTLKTTDLLRDCDGKTMPVQDWVRSMDLGSTVVCLGTLTVDEVLHVLTQMSLMVFPSLYESFGLPIVEAMSVGCPVAEADLP
jgi:glycosyltransferase involved in cell wall biosynthesis